MGKYADILASAKPWDQYTKEQKAPQPDVLESLKTTVKGDPANKGRKEAEILSEILQYLKAKGIWHKRIYTGGVIRGDRLTSNTAKGFSDIMAVIDGRAVFLEVKRPGGILSAEQRLFLMSAKENGAIAAVVTSVEDVIKSLYLPK